MNREIVAGAPWPVVRDALPESYELLKISSASDLEKLNNALNTQDLFAEDKGLLVVWLEDEGSLEPAKKLVEQGSREVLLAIEKKLTGKHPGFVIKSQTLPGSLPALSDWVTAKVSTLGGHIEKEAIAAITAGIDLKLFGWNDLVELGSELGKMITYSPDRNITLEVYQKMSAQGFSVNIFEILRMMSKKDAKHALIHWDKLAHQGVGPDQLIPLFAGQIGNLLLAKVQGTGFPDLAEAELGWERRKAQAVSYEAKNFNLPSLENALTKLLAIDIKRKTVSSDEESEMIGWLVENSSR